MRRAGRGALRRSPLLFSDHGIAHGAAGWGLACLHLESLAGDAGLRDLAVQAGEHLLRGAVPAEAGLSWPQRSDGRTHFRFGFGASGVALFLLHLSTVTGETKFRDTAERGLAYDIANRVETEVGWQWPRFAGDEVVYTYLVHGSAGIEAVAGRFADRLPDGPYAAWARRIATDVQVKYSYIPRRFEGLAGIGELQLDMFRLTGEAAWRTAALDIAESIGWFEIRRSTGATYPGRWLARISSDYATGSSGIGLFFCRLVRPRPRFLFDLGGGRWSTASVGRTPRSPAQAKITAKGEERSR